MRSRWRYLILGPALLLTGMRDPFQPPDDRCATGQLAQWQYRGWVNDIGLMQDGATRWHRVRIHDRLTTGWRVVSLSETALTIETGDGCEPGRWQWQRQGTKKNENKDSVVNDDTRHPGVDRRAGAGFDDGG